MKTFPDGSWETSCSGVFRGSRAQLLKQLVEQRTLTTEERSLLERILKEQDQ